MRGDDKSLVPRRGKGPACYGPVVRATAVYLMVAQHVPVARAAELFPRYAGHLSPRAGWPGWPPKRQRGFRLSFPSCGLSSSRPTSCTPTRPALGSRAPAIGPTSPAPAMLTLLDCHPKRGKEAFTDMAVLPFFSGVLITDGWKPYWSVEGIEHALCCAHLLRDLASLTGSLAHRDWADEMADLLVEVKEALGQALFEGRRAQPRPAEGYRARYTKLVNRGFAAVPPRHRAGSVHRDAYNLLCRFRTSATKCSGTGPTRPSALTITKASATSGWPNCTTR